MVFLGGNLNTARISARSHLQVHRHRTYNAAGTYTNHATATGTDARSGFAVSSYTASATVTVSTSMV